jgi:hypothetical protein
MSLTILVHREMSSVAIIRWFLDPKVSISYATGPLVHMPWEEFRAKGWDLVHRHVQDYRRIRLPEERATAVFETNQEKKFLKEHRAVRVRVEESGDLTLIPQIVSKPTLAGLESLGKETRRTISSNCQPELFWKTFDEVLSIASEP